LIKVKQMPGFVPLPAGLCQALKWDNCLMPLSRHAHFNARSRAGLNVRLSGRRWVLQSARFVLLWFALSIGLAIASPLIKPQAMALICTSAGATQLLVNTDEGVQDLSGHTLDCPLCANLSAPPPVARHAAQLAPPLGHVLHSVCAAHVLTRSAAPWPGRGPPAFS
jgi:hypothetical protein